MAGLSDKAMIANLTIGMISFSGKDKKITARVHEEVLHNRRKAGKWLKEKMNRDDIRGILALQTEAGVFHRSMTRPFGDDGGRLLPVRHVMGYCRKMGDLKRNFESERRKIMADWDLILLAQQERLGADFDPRNYPTRAKLGKTFRFDWSIMPVPDWASLHDQNHVIFSIESELTQEIIEKAKEDERNRLAESVGHLWARLINAVERMQYACADESGRVHFTMIDNLERESEIVRDLNFTDDVEITSITAEIKDRLCGWPARQIRKDKNLKLRLGRIADTILERMRARATAGIPVDLAA